MKQDMNKLIESFFARKENVLSESAIEDLVRNQFKLLREESYVDMAKSSAGKGYGKKQKKELNIKYSFIPEISVSEIGWSSLDTSGATPIASPQRQQLFDYLKNISGNTFGEKVKAINAIYSDSVETLEKKGLLSKDSKSSRVQTIMSYLVFLKTLTTIITNFNAASAGFSFESFLGVLLEGQQVKTGSGTIADLVTKDGINISLKLYAEGGVHVGGSFNDLVNDMVGVESMKIPQKPFIRYVVATKNLEGEGLDRMGTITVYQFDISVKNFANVLMAGGDESRKCIRIPLELINSGRDFSSLKKVPKTEKELRDRFQSFVSSNALLSAEPKINDVLDILKKSEKQPYNNIAPLFAGEKRLGRKGEIALKSLDKIIASLQQQGLLSDPKNKKGYYEAFRAAYDDLVKFSNEKPNLSTIQTEGRPKKGQIESEEDLIPGLKFATTEASVQFYNKADDATKLKALRNMYGYLETEQFGFTMNQVLNVIKQPDQEYSDAIGIIKVGRRNVEELLNKMVGELNSQIFEIFDSLNLLTTNINNYFATGMKDDNAADTAQIAASNIDKKTEEIQTQVKK